MSKNYDNWERLVAAVLRREHDRQIALSHSRDSSAVTSRSSSSRSLFHEQSPAANVEVMSYFNSADRDHPIRKFLDIRTGMTCFMVRDLNTSYGSSRQNWDWSFNDETGMICYMVGARDLNISCGNISQNYKWSFDADSSFAEVARVHYSTWRLDIRAKIKVRILHHFVVYAAYLVFKITERAEGLESAKAMIRFVDDESDTDAVKRAKTVHLQPVKDREGEIAVDRGDGWMEIEMGDFYICQWDDGDVEVRLLNVRLWMGGLIVGGVVFRPKYSFTEEPAIVGGVVFRPNLPFTEVPLVSKRCMSRGGSTKER